MISQNTEIRFNWAKIRLKLKIDGIRFISKYSCFKTYIFIECKISSCPNLTGLEFPHYINYKFNP